MPALFRDGYFSMTEGVWRSKILGLFLTLPWLFLIHYELFRKSKKCLGFFTLFLSDLDAFNQLPTQAHPKAPQLLGLKKISEVAYESSRRRIMKKLKFMIVLRYQNCDDPLWYFKICFLPPIKLKKLNYFVNI